MNILEQNPDFTKVGTDKRSIAISTSLLDVLDNPVILACPDDTWAHPNEKYNSAIILSDGNSKVNALGKVYQTKAVAYGKTTIASCPFAANCIKFCYQQLNNYLASARLHGHNYFQVYGQSRDTIGQRIETGLELISNKVTIVRLNDNGDFISKNEILAWADNATNNPGIVFYGYTKNTPHLYMARKEFGPFPSNLRINISDMSENDVTMAEYMDKLDTEYPNEFTICHIIDTPDRDDLYQSLPWNDADVLAYESKHDFKIALHVGVAQRQFCNENELSVNDKYSSGKDENGVSFC